MEDVKQPAETNEERKARLLAEAVALKVPHDANWTADQLQLVVDKAKAKKKPAPAPEPVKPLTDAKGNGYEDEAGLEGADGSAAEDALNALRAEHADVEAELRGQITDLQGELARVSDKLKVAGETIFTLEADKGALEVKLFDIGAKANNVVDRPEVTFGDADKSGDRAPPPRPTSDSKPTASGMVKCRVTKLGDGQIFNETGGRYKRGEVINVLAENVAGLETKGFVEAD